MATQKLPESREQIRVVGTSSYQDAIWRIVGAPTTGRDSRAEWQGEAALEPEPENRHDCHAVKVTVGGETVGYLDRELAARLQPDLLELRRHDVQLVVTCFAKGGFELREGGRASVGLVVAFDPRDVHRAAGAFLAR
jgi:hypothetical protein